MPHLKTALQELVIQAKANKVHRMAGMPALKQKGIGCIMIKEFKDMIAEMIVDRTMGMLA